MNYDQNESILDERAYFYPDAGPNDEILWTQIAADGGIVTQHEAEALHALPVDCTLAECRALLGFMKMADALTLNFTRELAVEKGEKTGCWCQRQIDPDC